MNEQEMASLVLDGVVAGGLAVGAVWFVMGIRKWKRGRNKNGGV